MPKTDHDLFDAGFEWRLKTVLDRVTPPASPPRYAATSGGLRPWRLAPVVLAAGACLLLALTVTAATGSPNPAVWTQRAASSIESVGHAPAALPPAPSPSPEQPRPAPARSAPVAPVAHQPEHEASPRPRPSERPEESPRPHPSASPSPWSDDHSGTATPTPSPRPSPSPDHGDH
jgi:hypothetical protein